MHKIYTGYIPIDGQEHLHRDMFSMGIVNTDSAALSRAKAEAAEALRRKHAVDASMSELNTLRNEVAELKQLVQQLVSAHQAKEGKN